MTVNPGGAPATPADTKEKMLAYIENYIPIRLARSLRNKLDRKKPYWELPEMKGKPFIIAVQDFHAPGAMRAVISAMTEYAFGVRHSFVNGKHTVEWLKERLE